MITAYTFHKAQDTIQEAQRIAANEMPNGTFVFIGLDGDFVYFNVVAKMGQITEQQVIDLQQKTRFYTLAISKSPVFKGQFKILINC